MSGINQENKTTAKIATTVVSLAAVSFSQSSALAEQNLPNEMPLPSSTTTIAKVVEVKTDEIPSLPNETKVLNATSEDDKTLASSATEDVNTSTETASTSSNFKGTFVDALQDFYSKHSDTIKSILAALGTFSLGYLAKGRRKGQILHGNLLNKATTMPCQFNFVAKENDLFAPCIRNFATTRTIEQIFGVEADTFLSEARKTDIKLPLIVTSHIKSQSGESTQRRWLDRIADEVMTPCDQAFRYLDSVSESLTLNNPDIYKKNSKVNEVYIFLTCEDGKNTTKDFPTKPRIFVLTKNEIEFYATKEYLNHAAVEQNMKSHIYRVNALHNICKAFVKSMPQDTITNECLRKEINTINKNKDIPKLKEGIHYVKRTRGIGETPKLDPIDQTALQTLRKTGMLKTKKDS